MKIIGVQILKGTIGPIKRSLNIGWFPLVKCENDLASDDMALPIVAKDGCPDDYYRIDKKRLPPISISAIAGKNGSGKSSLLEIIYRIINNFTACLLSPSSDKKVQHTEGLEARLFFEIDGHIKYIYNHNTTINYYEVDNDVVKEVLITNLSQNKRNEVFRKFFYTIAANYSLYALNSTDYDPIIPKPDMPLGAGEWLKNMFHKNDGYYIPIVLTPMRTNGEIKINNENHLAIQRLSVLSLLFRSQGKNFIEGYIPVELQYRYIDDYKYSKMESLRDKVKETRPEFVNGIDLLVRHFESAWGKLLMEMDSFSYDLDDCSNPRNDTIAFFLAYKSIKICLTYPSFRDMLDWTTLASLIELESKGTVVKNMSNEVSEKWLDADPCRINNIVRTLFEENSHITIKIHQCIEYIRNERYKDDNLHSISYKELIGDHKYSTYDEVFRLLPPSFFRIDLKLCKTTRIKSKPEEITLQTMSSGERQLLYSLSYVFYHLKNIASVQEDGKRVGYHHINLIFDEAELYYHPEFQRLFVKRLLDNLALCNINKKVIRSINIIIVTHSPFLLSDIPETNILFLGEGNHETNQMTFGANIYDLLKSSFFMDSAIGGFAEQKLKDLMDVYYQKDVKKQERDFEQKYNEFRFTAEHVADDYLRKTFQFMFNELEYKYQRDNAMSRMKQKLQKAENEVRRLRKQLIK